MGRLLAAIVVLSTLSVDPPAPGVVPAARVESPASNVNPSSPTRRPAPRGETTGGWGWLADPRSAVLLTMTVIVGVGGGARLMKSLRGRRVVARLAESDVRPEEVEEASKYGREGLTDLFRLLGTSKDPKVREAAGRSLARLWKADDLVVEEERALVLRGFVADWHARRRYPRDLSAPIPIGVEFGVPFLRSSPEEVCADDLSWSFKILGGERASLEQFSEWTKGRGAATFSIDPRDFPANGPHRLVLQARVATFGLTEPWELDLPQIPFSFEFDPILKLDALLTLDDSARAVAFERAVRLDPAESEPARFVPIGPDLLIRNPPVLKVATPLPCDLAHAIAVEFEGVEGRFPAGAAVVSGQGAGGTSGEAVLPLDLRFDQAGPSIDRPGEVRMRAVLTADPNLGWADPDVRSIWPGAIVTDWTTARVVRR